MFFIFFILFRNPSLLNSFSVKSDRKEIYTLLESIFIFSDDTNIFLGFNCFQITKIQLLLSVVLPQNYWFILYRLQRRAVNFVEYLCDTLIIHFCFVIHFKQAYFGLISWYLIYTFKRANNSTRI